MIRDLFNHYQCVLADSDEQESWKHTLKLFSSADIFVGYLPAITLDLWPVYVLECTKAKEFTGRGYKEHLYIVPVTGEFGNQEFSRFISDWYLEDKAPDDDPHTYGAQLSETILLKAPEKSKGFPVRDIGLANAVFADFLMPNYNHVYLFIVAEEAHDFWQEIEKHDIVCDFLIHSAKGLGDWFDNVPLSGAIRNSGKKELLPKYYFKGKYINDTDVYSINHAELIYSVPESGEGEGTSKIFATNWREG